MTLIIWKIEKPRKARQLLGPAQAQKAPRPEIRGGREELVSPL